VRILLSVAIAGLPALAVAASRTIDDCETIEAADAYNRCLATFGPPGRSLRLEPSDMRGDGVGVTVIAEPRATKGERARLTQRSTRRASTTPREIRAKRMVFSVVSSRSGVR
jgi:hypothetical protein